jgi:hypothetical protein
MYKTLELATPSATPKQTSRFSTFHPQTFAKQLAYFEYNMFKRIEAHEYHYWIKGEKDKRAQMAPNLYQVVNFVNQVSLWVATEIVTAANPKLRQTLLKKFVLVAQYCLKYKNYQGLLEIMGGLNSTAVRRLATWDEVSSKYSDMVDKLAEVSRLIYFLQTVALHWSHPRATRLCHRLKTGRTTDRSLRMNARPVSPT